MLTREQLDRMFPGGQSDWLDALMRLSPSLVKFYQWTDADWRHAMAQVSAETNGLRIGRMRENMRFTTAKRIKEVYSYRLRLALQRDRDLAREHGTVDALAAALVGKPDLLADVVYGGREGTPHGQGHRYIGRGPLQTTHLNNYRTCSEEIRRQPTDGIVPDLVETPEALEKPEWGIRALFAEWHIKGLSRWARDDDLDNVSSVLNAGAPGKISIVNGLPDRRRAYARALAVWPAGEDIFRPSPISRPVAEAPESATPTLKRGDQCEQVRNLQLMLEGLGIFVGLPDGCYGEMTERAVVIAQHEHGLPPTGEADARTIEVLSKSAKKDLPRVDMTERDLAERGSRTYEKASELTVWGKVMKWLGLPTGAAGLAETASPGTVTQLIGTAPKLAESLTSPAMLRLYAVGLGVGLLVIGWRLTRGGRAIIDYRLDDARTGKHIGR